MTDKTVALSEEERIPKGPGREHRTNELVDLCGPVARIARTTYVHHQMTELTLMQAADPAHEIPCASFSLSLDRKTLETLLERLKWPE